MLNESRPLDAVLQALADPTRRGIVERLSEGPAPVGALARDLPISLPAVLRHIAVLEAAGLAESRKQGRVRTVTLRPAALDGLESWLAQRQRLWSRRLDHLGAYLEETDPDKEAGS